MLFAPACPIRMPRTILPGKPYPQGATWDGTGVNFSLYSERATGVELCLFEDIDSPESERVPIWECARICLARLLTRNQTGPVVQDIASTGPMSRSMAHALIPPELLIDPYSQGTGRWVELGYPSVRIYSSATRPRGSFLRHTGRRLWGPQERSDDLALRLGERPAAAHTAPRFDSVRTAREGLHRPRIRRSPRSCTRNLCRA